MRPQSGARPPLDTLAEIDATTTTKLPSRKWRDLIRQTWHTDPLTCPECQNTMRFIAVIEDPPVIEQILRHMNLWCGPAMFAPYHYRPTSGADPPSADDEDLVETQNMPDYENVITD